MKTRLYQQVKAATTEGGGTQTIEPGTWSWGFNGNPQDFRNGLLTLPVVYIDSTAWDSIGLGQTHGVGIKAGKLYTWGTNSLGKTGAGTTSGYRARPTQVGTDADWVMCIASQYNTMAMRRVDVGGGVYENWLYGCGYNQYGELGFSGTTITSLTRTGAEITDWKTICFGFRTAFAISGDGKLYATGTGASYESGLNTTSTTFAWTCHDPANTGFKMVSGGYSFGIAIKENGEAWSWGASTNGQNGQSATKTVPTRIGVASDWHSVACGWQHSLFIKTDGSLHCCGTGANGRLGMGNVNNYTTITQVGTDVDWEAVACTSVSNTAGYFEFSLAIKGGKLHGTGINTYQQIGLSPTIAGSTNTFVEMSSKIGFTKVIAGQGMGMAITREPET